MTTIAAHDAGGAEIISSYVRQNGLKCVFALSGPAVDIFQRKLGDILILPLEQAIAEGEWLLSGTGWKSDFEWNALEIAQKKGKKTVAFLDHWTNYEERFIREERTLLPDEIWVGDKEALHVAHSLFPLVRIIYKANPYLAETTVEIERLSHPPAGGGSGRILFVSEPIRAHMESSGKQWGYDEDVALRFLLRNARALVPHLQSVVIRPHPSESAGKYGWVLEEFGALPVRLSGSPTLNIDIAACDIVVGCESMAMVVGLAAGRRVISCIPPGGKACALPHAGIEYLVALLDRQAGPAA